MQDFKCINNIGCIKVNLTQPDFNWDIFDKYDNYDEIKITLSSERI